MIKVILITIITYNLQIKNYRNENAFKYFLQTGTLKLEDAFKNAPCTVRRHTTVIEKVLPYKSKGVWMDVGFGNGSLLFTAHEYGFEPVAVDLRKENVLIMQQLGIQGYCDLVQNIKFEKPISDP